MTCKKCGTAERYENGQCKMCKRVLSRAHYLRNREKYNARSTAWRRANPERAAFLVRKGRRKGWQPGEHEKAEERRASVASCEACGSPDPRNKHGWSADHDHSTHLFRGIVCLPCNIAIAHVETYGLDRGPQIAAYLARTGAQP